MGPRPDWETMAAAAQATVLFPFCMNSDCLYNIMDCLYNVREAGGLEFFLLSRVQGLKIKKIPGFP